MTERELFEAWLNEEDPGNSFGRDDDGDYFDCHVHIQWQAWQAASKGRAELMELVRSANDGQRGAHTVMWQEAARTILAKHGA